MLTRGGVYLARLDPAKADEVGKIRPVVLLNTQAILDAEPPAIFVCPLSSKSHKAFDAFHAKLSARDSLTVDSYALTEHCRAISIKRLLHPRLAQLMPYELSAILSRLTAMVGS
jgi:mRNA interferase MazF